MRLSAVLAVLLASTASSVSADPSNVTTETAQFFPQYNSTRCKISYGPFTVAPMSVNNGMADFARVNVQMPCTDCLITWMQAGLEYPNGTIANADTNLWLHHTVFANLNRSNTVCSGPRRRDTFFASGNERTPVNICVNGTDQAGYYLAPTDTLGMLAELMNMSPDPQTGIVTMTYEYIPNPPSSFSKVKAVWLDIAGCQGGSDQPVKSMDQPFNYTSPPWVSDISGRVTFTGGHIHDGGTHLDVRVNGTSECDVVAIYGANSAYIGGGMPKSMNMGASSMAMLKPRATTAASMDMGSMTMSMPGSPSTAMTMPATPSASGLSDNVHISNMSTCTNPSNGLVTPGDVWTVTAFYDPTQRDLMLNANGTAAPIMGIAILYVADVNVTITSDGSTTGSAPGSASASASAKSAAVRSVAGGSIVLLMCLALGLSVL